MNRLGKALAGLVFVAGVVLVAQPQMPVYEPGPRSADLTILVDVDKADEAWPAWARAWCHDNDALCINANDDAQGVPMCDGDGAVAGYMAKTRATASQAARAAFTMDGVGVVIDGDADGALLALGWMACPEIATEAL